MLRQKRAYSVCLWVLLAVLLSGVFLPGSTADTPVATGAVLLSAGDRGVTFEVRVPWEQLRLEPVVVGDVRYVRVSLPGWSVTSEAGAPALPFLAREIGAPFGANVTVGVAPGAAHTVALSAPALPVATQVVEWDWPAALDGVPVAPEPLFVVEEDLAVYGAQEAYPGALARVASDGVLRQQRVAGIVAQPVQYHPATRELTVYESLTVTVTFERGASGVDQPPSAPSEKAEVDESAAYETLFRQKLLNHEVARAWRRPVSLSTLKGERMGDDGVKVEGPRTEERKTQGAGIEALSWAPPAPGWRVKVREEGFYKLTYDELDDAGLPVGGMDPRTFRLYHLGSEVAIDVQGEDDGAFDTNDYLLFYAQAATTKYTADNVYWLTYGQGTGLRMGSRDGAPGTADTPAYYVARRHMEQNLYYLSLTPGDDDMERWMWDFVRRTDRPSWTHGFPLAAPYVGKPATLTVAMLGYLNPVVNPDHHVTLSLNGTQVGEISWDGVTWQIVEVNIPQGLLAAGSNTLVVTSVDDTGYAYDVFYIDWVDLAFPNTFVAEGDELSFRYETSGSWKYQVAGFSTDQLAVYDVTNPAGVVRIEGIEWSGTGPYSTMFQDSVVATTRYWTMASTAYRTVEAIDEDRASSLRSTANGADHMIITHKDFATQAEQLRGFRASQGLRAMVVDVQDVYDEFGYGIAGTAPIHDFLTYAYENWQKPAPSYVVLMGDGHYDSKNYLGYGRVSYIPPYLAMADPWMGETAADNRYVTVVGEDTLPDMMLGRLSVNSAAEASAFVDKMIAYEQSPVPGDWQQQVLAVADNADSGGDFAQISDGVLSSSLPQPYQVQRMYYGVTHTDATEAQAAIRDGINAGKLIVNYTGHAYATGWAANPSLLTTADVPQLQNGGKLPVVLAMTCREGSYHAPDPLANGREALSEVVTRAAGGGAVASWSPTGLGVASGHDFLNRGFLETLSQEKVTNLGQATVAGKLSVWATGVNLELLDTYLLFGDPALRLSMVSVEDWQVHLPVILRR